MNSVKPMKTEREIYDIIANAGKYGGKYELMLHLGIFTGLRISDILRLRVCDVARYPVVVIEKKTKKKRQIEFSDELGALIDTYVTENKLGSKDYLIFSTAKNKKKPLSRIQAYRILRRSAEQAGHMGIGTHSMRKTFAVEHFRQHHDIQALQKLLNHKYTHTTVQYLFDINDINRLPL